MRILASLLLTLLAGCGPALPYSLDGGTEESTDSSPDLDIATPPDLSADCLPGSLGCPCFLGACAENLDCQEGICNSCPHGQIGCPCPGGVCDTDLMCSEGVCQPTL